MSLPPWSIHSLWAAAFPADDAVPTLDQLKATWRQQFGNEPEESGGVGSTEEPHRVAGKTGGSTALFEARPGRVELGHQYPMSATPATQAALPGFESEWRGFTERVRGWLPTLGNIKRFAIGAQLLHPFETSESMYRLLSDVLRVTFEENSADFVFQINRWSAYDLGDGSDFTLNRIARWAAIEVELPRSNLSLQASPACLLALDMNTSAKRDAPLPPKHFSPILKDLTESALGIALNGDIRPKAAS